jgi:hypothetical protein
MVGARQDDEGRQEFVHECACVVSRLSDLFPDNVVPTVVRIWRLDCPAELITNKKGLSETFITDKVISNTTRAVLMPMTGLASSRILSTWLPFVYFSINLIHDTRFISRAIFLDVYGSGL